MRKFGPTHLITIILLCICGMLIAKGHNGILTGILAGIALAYGAVEIPTRNRKSE